MFFFLLIFTGSQFEFIFETLGKIFGGGEACGVSHFCDGQPTVAEHIAGIFQFDVAYEFQRCKPGHGFYFPVKGGFGDMQMAG